MQSSGLDARTLFGFALLAIQAGLAAPLLLRLFRSRVRDGFSLMGETIWVALSLSWILYGLLAGSLLFTMSATLAALTSALVVALIWGTHASRRRSATIAAVLTALVALAGLWAGGVDGLGVVIAAIGAVQFLPQIIESVRQLRGRTPIPGVSPVAALARACYTLGWAIYGLGHLVWGADSGRIDWPLVTWGVAGAFAFVTLALAARVSRTESVRDSVG